MRVYTIFVCQEVFTGNKRTKKIYDYNDYRYVDEYETEFTDWQVWKEVSGIKNVYKLLKNERHINENINYTKKWYNEYLAFRNKREKKYYEYLERINNMSEIFKLLNEDPIEPVSIEDFKIKFDFVARDSFKGKVFDTYFCVADENGYIIDYDEIIEQIRIKNNSYYPSPFKKPRQHKGYTRYGPYYWRHPGNVLHNEMKQSITPQEIDDIYYEYGVHLKPCKDKRKKLHEYLAHEDECTKHERNWKKFRKHQWK